VQGSVVKRVFCNFDGCYSKRGGGGGPGQVRDDAELADPSLSSLRRRLLLLRLHRDAAAARPNRDDPPLTQSSDINPETADLPPPDIVEHRRRSQGISRAPPPTCCPRGGELLAKILR